MGAFKLISTILMGSIVFVISYKYGKEADRRIEEELKKEEVERLKKEEAREIEVMAKVEYLRQKEQERDHNNHTNQHRRSRV